MAGADAGSSHKSASIDFGSWASRFGSTTKIENNNRFTSGTKNNTMISKGNCADRSRFIVRFTPIQMNGNDTASIVNEKSRSGPTSNARTTRWFGQIK